MEISQPDGARRHRWRSGPVHIDCDRCAARGPACDDCVVTVLLGLPASGGVRLDDDECRALSALAGSGLVPPLRLVPGAARAVAVDPIWEEPA